MTLMGCRVWFVVLYPNYLDNLPPERKFTTEIVNITVVTNEIIGSVLVVGGAATSEMVSTDLNLVNFCCDAGDAGESVDPTCV